MQLCVDNSEHAYILIKQNKSKSYKTKTSITMLCCVIRRNDDCRLVSKYRWGPGSLKTTNSVRLVTKGAGGGGAEELLPLLRFF